MDNKFRKFVKKDKLKPFQETTELEAYQCRVDLDKVIADVATINKNLNNDIHNIVRKMTSHLKPPHAEGMNHAQMDALLIEAHADSGKPGSPRRRKVDENAKVKEYLVQVLS